MSQQDSDVTTTTDAPVADEPKVGKVKGRKHGAVAASNSGAEWADQDGTNQEPRAVSKTASGLNRVDF